jgi:predicted ester cyclase
VDLNVARHRYAQLWQRIGASRESLGPLLRDWYASDIAWHGGQPFNSLRGTTAVHEKFWAPLLASFPDLERRDDIRMCGRFRDGEWLATTGHYFATFARDFIGIRATGGAVSLRFGEFARFAVDRVVESYLLIDWIDLMRQADQWPAVLPRSLGAADRAPGPATADGLSLEGAQAQDSERSLTLVEAMIAGLMQYDGRTLASMGMRRFWQGSFMWYGPAGIGTARGLDGFERCHQVPFLQAFPDRVGGDHKCRIAEGHYVASTGWPSVRATHRAPYLGAPATNQRISMRVMDFWRREGNLLAENWVFIDLPDLLLQMGVRLLPEAAS